MMPFTRMLSTSALRWLLHLGGPGLVLLGIADNSVVPLTGSMDVATIWLSASQKPLWPYYAAMATAGSMIGGYTSYGLAKKGGKEAFERKLGKNRAAKVYRKFERHGFSAVAVGAMLPPPFPYVPVLLAAGALQYSPKRFLGALATGRGVRYVIVAFLGSLYGDAIVSFFSKYYKPALIILIGLAALGGVFSFVSYLRSKKRRTSSETTALGHKAA